MYDSLVVDAVAHPWNLGPENQNRSGRAHRAGLLRIHRQLTGADNAEYMLKEDEFHTDLDLDAFTYAMFAESVVDVAVLHALPSLGFTKGWLAEVSRMAQLRDRHPHRFLLYASVDTFDVNEAIRQLERQVRDFNPDGLKLYPAFFTYDDLLEDGRSAHGWRMDDPNYAIPLLEAAHDLGIRNVAVHKAQPVRPAGVEFFGVGDVESPLARFPDINFQIVHAGLAFLEHTRLLLAQFPNLYANLELTASYAVMRPRVFLEALGEMIYWSSADQILLSSGCNLVHPQPVFAAFDALEMPRDLIEARGYEPLTPEVKAKIGGGNIARLHGLDAEAVRSAIADDEFERGKADGLQRPWSRLRGEVPVA